MRLTGCVAALAVLASACAPDVDPLEGPSDALEAARAYVEDARARRRALEASVAVAETAYADLRSAHYALGGSEGGGDAEDWEALPVDDLRVRALRALGASASDGGEGAAVVDELDALDGPEATLGDWERAGAIAFARMPAQIDLTLDRLRDRETAERAGLVVEPDGRVRGAVEVETASGWVVTLTCAACHSAVRDGEILPGVGNDALALGALYGGDWPRGTLDVTSDGVENPVRPSDLRAIAHQARLHHAGNLANGRVARMVRIETLLITQRRMRARPDRRLVAAIALYLESLGRGLAELDATSEGAAHFARECARCHEGAGMSGASIDVALVGTDPRATELGSERGTGAYRAPSLRGVGDRRALLHDGSAADLDALLRLAPSEHVGHAFGLGLDGDARRAIASYLRAD